MAGESHARLTYMRTYRHLALATALTISGSPALLAAAPDFSLVGFATQNGGTTGGQGGDTVVVKNYTDLKLHAEGSAKAVILVEGTISNGTAGGKIAVKSNKSIIGVGSTAFLQGIGIDIGSQNNVIVRNLKITLVGTATPSSVNGGDCISIYGTSKNIWIDHNEIYSEDPSVQTDKDKYDGLLDIKGQTGFITLSWNYLHDHHKGGLVGAADDDLHADRKVTMHHNHYNKVLLRVPMYRGATGHFFNNYIVGAKDATEIRANTCLRVEKNYYESLNYSIYTPSDAPGKAERIDNVEVKRASRAYPSACTADIPYSYAAVLTSTTNDVKTIVPQYAGVGKIASATPANSAPVFTSAKSFTIPENTTAVTQCKATDSDGDALSFALSGGEDSAKFSLAKSTGILAFKTAPDYEKPGDAGSDNTYKVIVSASDGKTSTTQSIAVLVSDAVEAVGIQRSRAGLVLARVEWLDLRGNTVASEEQWLDPSAPRPVRNTAQAGVQIAKVTLPGRMPELVRVVGMER